MKRLYKLFALVLVLAALLMPLAGCQNSDADAQVVNILSANTQIIDGKTFGQLVLQLPDNPSAVSRMLLYLRQQGVSYQEENADVHG